MLDQIPVAVYGLLRVDILRPRHLDIRLRSGGLRHQIVVLHRGKDLALFHPLAFHDAHLVQHAFILRGDVDGPRRAHGKIDVVGKGMEIPVAGVRHGQHRILGRLHLFDMASAGVVDVNAVSHDEHHDADDAGDGDFQIFLRVHGRIRLPKDICIKTGYSCRFANRCGSRCPSCLFYAQQRRKSTRENGLGK